MRNKYSSRAASVSATVRAAVLILMASGAPLCAHAARGDIDVSFGVDGVRFIDGNVGDDRANAVSVLPDGAVLVAGFIDRGQPTTIDMAIVKLTPNGQVDTAFGDNGFALLNAGGDGDEIRALLYQPESGKILAAGALEPNANLNFGVARFNADGSHDDTFGIDDGQGTRRGHAMVSLGSNDFATALAVQSDGRIVLAGEGRGVDGNFTYPRFGLTRLTEEGELDVSFGATLDESFGGVPGVVISPAHQAQTSEYATGVALRTDGSLADDDSITVVGYVFARSQAVIRRYLANGAPDPAFDGDGTLVIDDALSDGAAIGMRTINAAALQDDKKIVVVGEGRDRAFVFMRFLPNGQRDPSFGVNGRVAVKFSSANEFDVPRAVTLLPDGRIIAAGYFTATYDDTTSADFAVVQLLPDGTPDPAFGDGNGLSTYPLSMETDSALSVAATNAGSVVAAGYAQRLRNGETSVNEDIAVLRLEGDTTIFADGFGD